MKKFQIRLYIFGCILILAVGLAVVPLFQKLYIPTHDGEYHIIRIVEFAKMIKEGYLLPRWAPDLNSGYGMPIFQYFYPLPNYVGTFISSFLHDAVRSFQMAQAAGYILAVFALFGWLLTLFGFIPAVVGAVVGAYIPYWFVDIYVRGSIGEVWATAFLFCTLYVAEKKKYPFVGICFGLLILSHNILAMIYTPVLIGYFLLRNRKNLLGILSGIGLAAYFWLPAIFEQKYVIGLNTVNFREHFVRLYELLIPSWGTEFSGIGITGNTISFQIGVIPLIVLFVSLFLLFREKDKKTKVLVRYFILVFILALLFMLPWSQRLWEFITPLQLIQYPWRLLSLGIPTVAVASAYWVSRMKKSIFAVVLLFLAIIFSYSYTRPVQYEPRNEAYYVSRSNFSDGTSSMGNSFSTIWTGWKETRAEAPYIVKNGSVTAIQQLKYLDKTVQVEMIENGVVTVNTVYFPGWKAFVDGKETPIVFMPDGVIHITVNIGSHIVRVQFTDTFSRRTGNFLSIFSLGWIIGWGILSIYASRYRHIAT